MFIYCCCSQEFLILCIPILFKSIGYSTKANMVKLLS